MASSSDTGRGRKVVLDTNALLMPFEFSLNLDFELRGLLGDYEILVPGPVVGELKRSKSRFARAALEFSRRYSIVETEKQGDDGVADVAARLGAFVLTNDVELQRKLRKMKIKTIRLRSRSHLVLDED
ncbi:MAG: PIN domain-containing protein [Methanomassiliicoccales archaeon]|jgi:rRNA-processing protein FCF1